MNLADLGTDTIREALGMTGTPPYCPRAASVHLTHKNRQGAGAVARLGCKSWACVGCADRLRWHYGQSLVGHFLHTASPVRETATDTAGWVSLKNRMNYLGAEYVKIAERDGRSSVLHTAETCDRPLATLEAINRLGELLRGIQHTGKGGRFRPVQTSRGWSLPARVSEYQFAGLVPYAHPDKVRTALEAGGAKVKRVETDVGGWLYVYQTDGGSVDLAKRE